jgi:hypothetical protein
MFAESELDPIFASYAQSNERLARHLGMPSGVQLFPERAPLPPLYPSLIDEDFHRIDTRVTELLAERQANRLRNRPSKASPKPRWRRLLSRIGFGGGRQ